MNPKFSIVIPCLNEEKFIPHLLTSLTEQTIKNFEIVVVDGSSTDNTVAEVKKFEHKIVNLQIIISDKASLPLQRNLGASHTRGDWLIFADADTVLMPYFIERIEWFINRRKPSFFTAWFRPDSEASGDALITLLANMMFEGSVIFHRPLSPGPLTIVTRKVYDLVGGYDEKHAFHEDMDFSLRAYKQGISLNIFRETIYILSLRRLRQQGVLTVLQQYIRASLPVLFFNKTMTYMPGYVMGGQIYDKKKKPVKQTVLRRYERKLKKLVKEFWVK